MEHVDPASNEVDEEAQKTPSTTGPPSEELVVTVKTKGKGSKRSSDRTCSKGGKKSKKAAKSESESESSDVENESETSSSTSEDSSDEDRKSRRKKNSKKIKGGKVSKKASAKSRKAVRYVTDSSESDSSSESSTWSDSESSSSSPSSAEEEARRRRRRRAKKYRHSSDIEVETEDEAPAESDPLSLATDVTDEKLLELLVTRLQDKSSLSRRRAASLTSILPPHSRSKKSKKLTRREREKEKAKKKAKKGTLSEFKRVNHVWDNNIHTWKTTEEVEENVDEFDEYAFLVRRMHDWDGHYTKTTLDVKSKHLKEVLMEIMKDVQGETLEAEQPSIDPNMLFNFLEELRTFYKKTLKSRLKREKKRKQKKKLEIKINHCKLLVKYLDEDFEETKKTLYPLLEAGNITFELLWALFKPNTLAYTSTYGDHDNPRCIKVDRATKESSFIKGDWYSIEGRYLEYDGKNYGLGEIESTVEAFKGSRKITSLAAYPLQYHKDPAAIKKQLVDRGKRFVTMTGQNYRNFKGLAFMKRRKGIQKFNINGRVMVDPSTFRRINPNYQISLIKPKDDDDEEDDDSEADCCGGHGSDEDDNQALTAPRPRQDGSEEGKERTKLRIFKDTKGKYHFINVPIDEDGREIRPENLDKIASDVDADHRRFSEEELLIASPVVLGFAFQEKQWLEFSLSGITEIQWNDEAYASLVLPTNKKQVTKALVSAHKFHGSKTIDDVVQGKGKGLVFVLHGPPGVGKTLTAEGVAEDLRVPLYMVSMGELAMDSTRLETMLQTIMDIAHSWGAVLLLDEADVFLEKRQTQDVHRNALVSVFLRLLEYFQGILFLTTNRVETFDEAFQSRIHVALKYEELSFTASRTVWREFIEKVRRVEGMQVDVFSNDDYDHLARKRLNGRQIKNVVRTAQALALYEKSALTMEHLKRVLDVAESFDRDLKGGTGYIEAMRSYT